MIGIEDIIKEISRTTKIDERIIDTICKHPFICTERIMKDESDTRDILFNKLFKFKLKPKYKHDKMSKYRYK